MSAPKILVIGAPMAGWCLPLSEVPDPVFAEGMAGDGVAIDPTSGVVVAPCDGQVIPVKGAKHAVTIRTETGIEVLVHVGIDTVHLGGEGFTVSFSPGEFVRAGQKLIRFDLDHLARNAPSLVTPVVVASGGRIVKRATGRLVGAGDAILEVVAGEAPAELAPTARAAAPVEEMHGAFVVPFDHGLHVRPASQVVATLKPFACEVSFVFEGRSANARSAVAMMGLGVRRGDTVEVRTRGSDGHAALEALEDLLGPESGHAARKEAPISPVAAMLAAGGVRGSDPGRLEGAIASRGIAIGRVVQWTQPELSIVERGSDAAGERIALDRALDKVQRLMDEAANIAQGERRALLAAHRELAGDPELRSRADEWIGRGKSAAFAWRRATRAVAETLGQLDDARMRERAADLRDLENQVLLVLAGQDAAPLVSLDADSVLVADDLPPSALIGMDRGSIAGIALALGGPTSHVSILAAAAGIPALVALGPRALAIRDGTPVVLDAEHGWMDVNPPAAELAAIERSVAQREQERAADVAAAMPEAHTRDGVRIRVNANLGSLDEVEGAVANGAEGCGLLRTEFLYLDRREAPGEDEQAGEYQRIATALDGRPLTIRTMDVGGDKPMPYLPMPHEENPALGLRGVRASFWKPELLRTQLRAILRVRPHGQCRILLPMVTDAEEVSAIRAIVEACARDLGVAAVPQIGAMIETPASALLADQVAQVADFMSIGSNDLSQYALAIDRAHTELGRKLDALHPAVLRLIALVADAGNSRGKSVSLCGALGSDVDALPILVGLGVHEVSAAPAMVPRLKRTARLLDAAHCREAARRALELSSAAEVRDLAAVARAQARAASESTSGGSP
jgi:phosphoenolpyruvate-protein phosphotransferase